ncbi:MAG: DUF3850 domain-containing protein [Clostridiales bacterium]|nr:DUF3850 domain-containing protein [Clostridiales bacterium]
MKLHELKIKEEYALAKIQGKKTFEIRLDDRNYQVGDLIHYTVEENQRLNNVLKNNVYQIVYITDYNQKGAYVVFAEKQLNK